MRKYRLAFSQSGQATGWGFPGGSVVKNLPANAGDMGSIPGSGRSPGEGNTTHSSILAWRIPWTASLVGYSPWGSQKVGLD